MRLSESRLRVVLSIATPPLLLTMAWGSWAVEAPLLVTGFFAVMTAGLGYVTAFDFATAIEVNDSGVHRICLLRRQLLPWDEISGIVQPRKRGLVLITRDRKRHILLDRYLEEGELDLLRTQVGPRDVQIGF